MIKLYKYRGGSLGGAGGELLEARGWGRLKRRYEGREESAVGTRRQERLRLRVLSSRPLLGKSLGDSTERAGGHGG